MRLVEVRLTTAAIGDDDIHLISTLRGVWCGHGQVLSGEMPTVLSGRTYRMVVMVPHADALDVSNNSQYGNRALAALRNAGFKPPVVIDRGEVQDCEAMCKCVRRSSIILYTTYITLAPSLRCGDCFGPIALYKVPYQESTPRKGALHDRLRTWQHGYQACDQLQMGCTVGERFGLREMSQHDSALSRLGLEICREISGSMGVPTYYYLHRYRGRSRAAERRRRCPACAGAWALPQRLHNLFDFRCERCRLLSNIAMSFPT